MAKLFFALPATAISADLSAWRAAQPWPGEWVPPENFHLTLAFLGHASPEQTAALMTRASRQHCPPLRITLDSVGYFARPKVAWVGPQVWPNELTVLAHALRHHGEQLGLGNGEKHYRPHVTLARKAPIAPPMALNAALARAQLTLCAQAFALYQSVSTPNGVRYEPLASWPLRPRP
ncbi:MAG: RNA 2',3'-cyclic phosphodiesterase [Aeromonas sp.]